MLSDEGAARDEPRAVTESSRNATPAGFRPARFDLSEIPTEARIPPIVDRTPKRYNLQASAFAARSLLTPSSTLSPVTLTFLKPFPPAR